jgi:hypothetical protein
MEPGSLLSWSKEPATCPYPESAVSSPQFRLPYFPDMHSRITLRSTPRSFEWSLPSRFSKQNFVYISHLCLSWVGTCHHGTVRSQVADGGHGFIYVRQLRIYWLSSRWQPTSVSELGGFLRTIYDGVSKSFRNCRPERELQMVLLSADRCSFTTLLWVSLVSFTAITLCVASRVFIIVSVYYVIDSVRKILDTPSQATEKG